MPTTNCPPHTSAVVVAKSTPRVAFRDLTALPLGRDLAWGVNAARPAGISSTADGLITYRSFPEKVAADLELDVDEAEAMVIGAAAGTLDVPALATIVGKALLDRLRRPSTII